MVISCVHKLSIITLCTATSLGIVSCKGDSGLSSDLVEVDQSVEVDGNEVGVDAKSELPAAGDTLAPEKPVKDNSLPAFNLKVSALPGLIRRYNVSASGLPDSEEVRIIVAADETCNVILMETKSKLPTVLTIEDDGRFYVCGFAGTTGSVSAANSPVPIVVDTTAPAVNEFDKLLHGETFEVALQVTDISAYTVQWIVVTGADSVSIDQQSASTVKITASDWGEYVIKAIVTDDSGHVTEREINFEWRYCADSRLSNAPYANSGVADAGTVVNPFRICTLEQLDQIRLNLGASFELWADIDAVPTKDWDSGAGFSPIGTSGAEFTGVMDGRGHKINGLKVHRTSSKVGLFGFNRGTIKNISVTDADVSGSSEVGILVGFNAGLITNCTTSGQVTATASVAGGLAGYNNNGIVEFSNSSATVTGTTWTGGLVGANLDWNNTVTILRDSFATGNVTGTEFVGGLIGGTWGSNSQTIRSYATGSASGVNHVGGLAGNVNTGAKVKNCYSTGPANGTDRVGGFVGTNYRSSVTYSYSTGSATGSTNVGGFSGFVNTAGAYSSAATYWDKDTSGNLTSVGASVGRTTAEMKLQASFNLWDFDTVWTIDEGTDYPKLR